MADLNVYEVLNRKRRGAPLDAREIEAFIGRFTNGDITDYQMSALLMACFILLALLLQRLGAKLAVGSDPWQRNSNAAFQVFISSLVRLPGNPRPAGR